MGVLPDWQIERDIKIEPFAEGAARPGVISYGVSSYGYDVRVGRHFKVFEPYFQTAAITDISAAWAAGIIDGEGHIRTDTGGQNRGLHLSVANTNRPMLEQLQGLFQTGQIYEKVKKKETNKQGYEWVVTKTQHIQEILIRVLPYLTVKRRAAQEALSLTYPKAGLPMPVVDPKSFPERAFVDIEGDHCLIPPNSFALAETVEYLEIPRDIVAVCVGKCLTGDTRVVDAETGDYLPLRDFVSGQRRQTLALDGWKLRPAGVAAHLCNGIQPVYRLTTRAGLQIKATATHPFRALDGWMPLAALRAGGRIAVARSCPVFGREDWPEHEATLLGLLVADGQCRTPGSCPRYTTGDPRLVEVLADAVRAFGCQVSPVGRFGYNLVNRVGRGGIAEKNRVAAWLRFLGCAVLSVDKSVPGTVFRARRPAVAAFLRALFSGDGSVYTSTSWKGTRGVCLEYASSSERLARDVRHLLLRFGIFGLFRARRSASGRTAYRVQITDPEMIRKFGEDIGFVSGCRKDHTLRTLLGEIGDRPRRRSNFDTLPTPAWELLREAAHTGGRSLLSLGGHASNQSVPLALAQTVAESTGDSRLGALAGGDVVWDTVRTIESAGREEVFDLTVPGSHSFLANDITVHNSTYARCGIIVNVTPLEPEWRGRVTIEISNTTPLPAKIYAGEGIAQILFLRTEAVCARSYADKQGKYQDQKGLTLPFVLGPNPPQG